MFKKIAGYSAGLYAVTVFAAAIRVALKSLIAKTLGKEALGTYSYFASAQLVGIAFLSFGMVRTLAKYVAASSKENKDYGQMVSAILVLLTGLSAILVAIAFLLKPYLEWIWFWILVGIGPATIFVVAQATLRGQFDRNRELIAAFSSILLQGISVAVFVALVATSQAPVMGLVVANLLVAVLILGYFVRRQPVTWQPSLLYRCYNSPDFRRLVTLAAPLWITNILGVVGRQADIFIVEKQLGYVPLAEYAAAFTFIGLLNQPTSVLSRMFLVTFASGFYTDIEKYKRVSSLNFAFISTLGLAITVISIPLTPIIFTTEYTLAPLLAAILSITFVFKSAEVLNTALTIAQDYPQANLNSKIWTLVIYLPSAFLLVSYFGVIGAAISNVISGGGYALIHALFMKKRMPQHAVHTFRQSLLGVVVYIGVILTILLINSTWILLLAVPVYLGVGQLLRLWDLAEIPGLIKRLLPERFTG